MASKDNLHFDFQMPVPPENVKNDCEIIAKNAKGFGAVVAKWTEGPKVWRFHAEWEPHSLHGWGAFAKWMQDSTGIKPTGYARPEHVA